MAAYWEIAAHSAYDVFSKYKCLIVNLGFPTSVCLLVPFTQMCRMDFLIFWGESTFILRFSMVIIHCLANSLFEF